MNIKTALYFTNLVGSSLNRTGLPSVVSREAEDPLPTAYTKELSYSRTRHGVCMGAWPHIQIITGTEQENTLTKKTFRQCSRTYAHTHAQARMHTFTHT